MHNVLVKASLLLLLLSLASVTSQRTSLDVALKEAYRPLRLLGLAFAGRSGDDGGNVQRVRSAGVSCPVGGFFLSLLLILLPAYWAASKSLPLFFYIYFSSPLSLSLLWTPFPSLFYFFSILFTSDLMCSLILSRKHKSRMRVHVRCCSSAMLKMGLGDAVQSVPRVYIDCVLVTSMSLELWVIHLQLAMASLHRICCT